MWDAHHAARRQICGPPIQLGQLLRREVFFAARNMGQRVEDRIVVRGDHADDRTTYLPA